jgi:hypothetical protein
MKIILVYAVGCLLVLNGCEKKSETASRLDYKGDGDLISLDYGGWKVVFEEFPLAEKFSASYFFVGLPEKLRFYEPCLYVPPVVLKNELNDAQLAFKLYADNELVSSFNAPIKQWNCWGFLPESENDSDGRGAKFCSPDVRVPAKSNIHYKLVVDYTPPPLFSKEVNGYFLLQMGGHK